MSSEHLALDLLPPCLRRSRLALPAPSWGRPLLLSQSEPSLFITSLALLHLGQANPSCPQACSKNSTEHPLKVASTATGAVLEPPRPAGLLSTPTTGQRSAVSRAVILRLAARCTWDMPAAGVQAAAREGFFHPSCQESNLNHSTILRNHAAPGFP